MRTGRLIATSTLGAVLLVVGYVGVEMGRAEPTPPPFLKSEGIVVSDGDLEIIWRGGFLQDRKCLLRVRVEHLPKDLVQEMTVWQPAEEKPFVQHAIAKLEAKMGPFKPGDDVKVLETGTAGDFFSKILVAEVAGQHFLYVEW